MKSFTTNKILITIYVFLLIFNQGCHGVNDEVEGSNIQIGAILPLTGEAGYYGQEARDGIEMAIADLGDTARVEIIYEDSQADNTTGLNAYNKLVSNAKTPAIITFVSGVVLSISPRANDDEVVIFNTLGQSPDIDEAGEYVFSNINSANIESYQLAEFIYESWSKEIAVVNADVSYGIGSKNAFVDRFKSLGGEVVLTESFREGETNFAPIINKLRRDGIEYVFVPAIGDDVAMLVRQSFERGYKPQWFSFTSFEGDNVIDIGGQSLNGLIYSSSAFDVSGTKFSNRFKERYNDVPELWAATSYDAVIILNNAVSSGNYSGNEIKNYLTNMGSFNGVSGETKFQQDGTVNKPVLFKIVRNKKFEKLNKYE